MKPKVLLIYIDMTAKMGIIPYLSSVFSSYLDFDSCLIDQIDVDKVRNCQLILFSSEACRSRVYDTVCDYGIPMHQCIRDFNYAHIHKILEIPSRSKVSIVSSRENYDAILTDLLSLGFTQYDYVLYYPGGPQPDPVIQYAITLGEPKLVPPSIRNVIDIGSRNVAMSTLCYIINLFHLPETIINRVSEYFTTYISNFMRYINLQLEEMVNRYIVRDKLLDTLRLGLCITDITGKIVITNMTFCSLLQMSRTTVQGQNFLEMLKKQNAALTSEQLFSGKLIPFQLHEETSIYIYFYQSYVSPNQEQMYLFLVSDDHSPLTPQQKCDEPVESNPLEVHALYNNAKLDHIISGNSRLSEIRCMANIYAESPFPVLILGETGLYQSRIAYYIHSVSCKPGSEFRTIDASNNMEKAESIFCEKEGITIFINHLECASREFQSFLCGFFNQISSFHIFSPAANKFSPKIICSYEGDIKRGIQEKTFLPELFYQISTLTLSLPSLREIREEIPALINFFFEELFLSNAPRMESIFTQQLTEFLMEYDYPGNYMELENLCRYFYCIFNGKKVTLAQLPSYIHYETPVKEPLSFLEKEVLDIIWRHPHSGRNKILILLSDKGINLTPHQIRSILSKLSGKAYIQILKTKQGCEITELGEYVLLHNV